MIDLDLLALLKTAVCFNCQTKYPELNSNVSEFQAKRGKTF